MEALAGRVEAERGLIVGNMDMQAKVGVGDGHVGAHAGLLAELVGNGVLHLIGHEFGMAELLGEHHGVNGKGFLVVQILSPVD